MADAPHIFEVVQEDWPTRSFERTVQAESWAEAEKRLHIIHLHAHNPRWLKLRHVAVLRDGRWVGQRGPWVVNQEAPAGS